MNALSRRFPSWTGEWLKDARLLLASQVVAMVATTGVAIILARSLGPSEWGLFSGLLGLSLALSTFVDLGLGTWLLRELSAARAATERSPSERASDEARRLASAVSANSLLGGVILVAAGVILASGGTTLSTAVALLGLITYTTLLAASNCLETFYRAERRLKTVVTAVVLEKFVLLACVGAVVLLDYGLWSVGVAYVAAGLCRLGFVANLLVNRVKMRFPLPHGSDIAYVVRAGVPFAFGTVALNVIPRLDTLLVAVFSTTAAGYFALGDRVIGPALILPVVASAALYPFLARDRSSVGAGWRISAGMFALGGVLALGGTVLAPILVPAIFGTQYDEAIRVVQIMCFVLPFLYASNPLLARLYTAGMERSVLALTLVASLIGTGAIVVGQIAVGPAGAASGYVLRHVLFTISLSGLSIASRRRRRLESSAAPGSILGEPASLDL